MEDIFGENVLKIFKTDPVNAVDYFEFWQNFEVKKREPLRSKTKTTDKIRLNIPVVIIEIAKNQMQIKGKNFEVLKTCLGESKYRETGICCEVGRLVLPSPSFEKFFSLVPQQMNSSIICQKCLQINSFQMLKQCCLLGAFLNAS